MKLIELAGGTRVKTVGICVGVAACLLVMAYGLSKFQRQAGDESGYRLVAQELQVISRNIRSTAIQTVQGDESKYVELAGEVDAFEEQLGKIQSAQLYDCLLYTSPSPRD